MGAFNRRSRDEYIEEPTTDLYMSLIVADYDCPHHGVPAGMPCYLIASLDSEARGVCDMRARRAGFNAFVSPASRISRRRRTRSGKAI